MSRGCGVCLLLVLLAVPVGVLAVADEEEGATATPEHLLARAAAEAESAEALRWIEQALAIYEKSGDRAGTAAALHALAGVRSFEGDLQAALELERRALAIYDALGSDGEERIVVLLGLGRIHRDQGEYALSRTTLEAARAHARRLGSMARSAEAGLALGETRAALGASAAARAELEEALTVFRHLGHAEGTARALLALAGLADMPAAEAVAHAQEALAIFRESLAGATVGVPWRVGGLRAQIHRVGLKAAVSAGDAEAALVFAEGAGAASLLEDRETRKAMRAAPLPPELSAVFDRAREALRAAEVALTKARKRGNRGEIRSAFQRLQTARDALLAAGEWLERERRRMVDPAPPEATPLAAVQAALDAHAALVLFAAPDGPAPRAVVITAEGARVVPLEAIDAWPAFGSSCGTWDAVAVERLRRHLVLPLDLPESATRLVVVPDGPLAFVPPILLFPERDTSYVPSASFWLRLQKDRALAGTGVLAVADARPGESPFLPHLLPLPATREEARAVGTVLLLGEDATRARLLAMLEREEPWRAVHFAGHALFDVQRPLLSALVLTPTPEDFGLLTLLDVLHLDVSADLVVLSSSESARGRAYPGEGVIGFPRAFLLCGVPRVIGALSCPDDEATAALMIRFHELWRSAPEDGAAPALRRAQDRVRQEERWAHPRYWAGWVLWGLGS